MSTFDDALTISAILIMVILVPWLLFVFMPAFLQAPIGNSAALYLLEVQGFHWIITVVIAIILLVLWAGAWLAWLE